MTPTIVNEVRHGFYLDSVALMRISRTLKGLEGVEEAALMMGTPPNKRIMADAGILAAEGEAAAASDLIVGIRAADDRTAAAAATEARELLERPRAGGGAGTGWRPHTLGAAVEAAPGSNLALISVPGHFAAAEARKALGLGLNVMIFSDNVAVADERALKEQGRKTGRLVMGPDCGTAIIGGVPLAFANRVPRGDVGIIGASGTGTQEVSCLIAQGGGGISHAIGVGGRDLTDEIGGITTLMALDALDADAGTRHVVLISKPPAPGVADRVLGRIAESPKSFTICFIGAGDMEMPANARQVKTLKAAAASALNRDGEPDVPQPGAPLTLRGRKIAGLFAGGTLCAEAQVILCAAGEVVASNAPVPGAQTLDADDSAHRLIDLGADQYTQGRPHPMIEPAVRDDALAAALDDPQVGVLLIDVVIGHGAHPDPAGHLAGTLGGRQRDGLAVVASVTGVEEDPQVRSAQVAKLEAAGVLVAPSNADAAAWALACIGGKD